MIPSISPLLQSELRTERQPSLTYRMDENAERIIGTVDQRDAMRQAIEKALLTERYQYAIYGADYGIETLDLYGQPISYVCPELERRITEALVCDDRIESITDFEFDTSKRGVLHASFTVHTIFGNISAVRELQI